MLNNIKEENINNIIELKIPSKEKLLIIPRLIISGILSEYDVSIEKVEDIKLILNEAASLLLTVPTNNIEILIKWEKLDKSIKLELTITSKDINEIIINNLMKSGLRIHILNYLCNKFSIDQKQHFFTIYLEKRIDLD